MADEVISFTFKFDGQDQFAAAMNQMAAAAEQMAAKTNAAFASIKSPQAAAAQAGQTGQGAQNPFQQHVKHAEEAKNKIGEFSEMIGGYAVRIGSQFGESGRLLGEFSEKALLGFGAIGGALGGIERTASAAESQIVRLGKATGSHELRSEGYGVGGIAGLARFLTNPATALVGVGVAGLGLSAYAGEQAEQMEKMAMASRQTLEEFRGMSAVAQQSAISTEAMAHAVENVREGVRQGALGARQMAEQFSLLSERANYFRDRIAQMAVMRAESAHQAADEDAKMAQSIGDAERKLQEAQEAYSRHGRPLTDTEKRDKEEKDRKRAVEDAERNLAELQHQRQDQERRHAEQMQQQKIAEERATSMQRREEEQLTLARRRATEEAPPIQRAFLQYAQRVEGIKDFNAALAESANLLDKVKNKSSLEQFGDVLKVFDSLRKSGVDITRGLDEAFGDQAAKIRNHMDELVAAINKGPKALKELADSFGILPTEGIEGLVKYQESIDKTLMAIKNLAMKGGDDFRGLIDTAKGLSSVLEGIIQFFSQLSAGARQLSSGPGGTQLGRIGIASDSTVAQGVDKLKQAFKDVADKAKEEGQRHEDAGVKVRIEGNEHAIAAAKVQSLGEAAATAAKTLQQTKGDAQKDTFKDRFDAIKDAVHGAIDASQHAATAVPRAIQTAIGVVANAVSAATSDFSDTTQRVPRYGGGGTTDIRIIRPPVAGGPFDYVVGHDPVTGHDILASGARRVVGPRSPGDNIRTNPYYNRLDGQQHGGLISGPGTGTSDSIIARVSAGEYVVKASAVNRVGRGFMDAVNSFADGGLVASAAYFMPRYQFGGEIGPASAAAALHPVTIQLPSGEKIAGFHGTADAVAALSKASVLAQASSTGRKPSWFR